MTKPSEAELDDDVLTRFCALLGPVLFKCNKNDLYASCTVSSSISGADVQGMLKVTEMLRLHLGQSPLPFQLLAPPYLLHPLPRRHCSHYHCHPGDPPELPPQTHHIGQLTLSFSAAS